MFQVFHGFKRGVRKRSERRRASDRSIVVPRVGAPASRIDASGTPPRIIPVANVLSGVSDSISVADQRNVAIVFEIVCVGILLVARVKAQKGVVGKEKFCSISLSDIEFDVVIGISIDVVITLAGATPPATILDRPLRLSRPSGVIHRGWDGMSRRRDREQINDHRLIPSY